MGGIQRPYTVPEVAALTGFSRRTIIRMFEDEPGILVIERPERLHKRRYRNIRIPRAVFQRVFRRVSPNVTVKSEGQVKLRRKGE